MLICEATFGRTRCLIHIRRIARPGGQRSEHEAELCVIETNGRALRFVGDREGNPVTVVGAHALGALARATLYLEARFGPLRSAPAPPTEPRVVHEPPLKDERPTG